MRDEQRTKPPTFEGRLLPNPNEEVFDQGLAFDLVTILDRRRALELLGYSALGAGLVAIVGCGPSSGATTTTAAVGTTAAATSGDAACAVIPEETAGPYPGDGSNGPDVLAQSGVVRRDIRPSFGEFSGTAAGIPLDIELTIQDAANGCAPFAGAAVYLWHCDRDGDYSLYTITDQNYLRGVQAADDDGVVRFTSIFPGCYAGRWPHIHFEVYRSLAEATDDANKVSTSQIALPEDACAVVYRTDGYAGSLANLSRVTLGSDNVFGDDGGRSQLGAVEGSVDGGYVVRLTVPVTT